MGWYIFTFLVGAAVGAGGVGFLYWRYSTKIKEWAATAGVKLP